MAYADGKDIEFRMKGDEKWERWIVAYNLEFNFDEYDYRIKQEPTYRPFKSKDECWKEMQKHQPFGWLKEKVGGYCSIRYIKDGIDYKEAFEEQTFADGTPFGIKEE